MSPAEQHPQSEPSQSDQTPAQQQVLRGGAGNVDKIRDILFGSQMRDYESRFARLEETLVKETAEIRETNRRRFDQLENYIRKEFETVQTRLKAERDERSDSADRQSRELRELSDSLSRRIRDLDDRETGVERDLRGDLLQQARELTEEIRARHDELTTILGTAASAELRDGKTDRAALATPVQRSRLAFERSVPDTWR